MSNIEILIAQVHEYLIETENVKHKQEIYNEFVNECKANELTEDDFYKKVLKFASKGVEDIIEEKKKEETEKKSKLNAQKELEKKAKDLEAIKRKEIKKIIDAFFLNGFEGDKVQGKALLSIFSKATEASIDIPALATRIYDVLEEKKFRAHPPADFEQPTLRDMLCSTDWLSPHSYKIETEKTIVPPKPAPIANAKPISKPITKPIEQEPRKSNYAIWIVPLFIVIAGFLFFKFGAFASGESITKAEEAFLANDYVTAKTEAEVLKDIKGSTQSEAQMIYDVSTMMSGPYASLQYRSGSLKYMDEKKLISLYDSLVQRVPIQKFLHENIRDKTVKEVLRDKLAFYDEVIDEMIRRSTKIANAVTGDFMIAHRISKRELISKYCIKTYIVSPGAIPSKVATVVEKDKKPDKPVKISYPSIDEYKSHLKGYKYCAIKCLDEAQLTNFEPVVSSHDASSVTINFNIDGTKCACVYTLELQGTNYIIKGKCEE